MHKIKERPLSNATSPTPLKHIDKLKSSGVLQIEDRTEAAKKIRELMFGKYTKEQLEAAQLAAA